MGKKKIEKLESQVEKLQSQLKEMAAVIDSIAEAQKKTSAKVLEALEKPEKGKVKTKVTKAAEAPTRRRTKKTAAEDTLKTTAGARRGRPKKTETGEATKEAPKTRRKRVKKEVTDVKTEEPVKTASEPGKEELKQESGSKTTNEPEVKWEKEPEPSEKAKAKERKPRAPRTDSVVLYNCDEAKTPESMFNRGDEVFRDTIAGRRALLKKLKTEIAEGRIALLNNYPPKIMQIELLDGNYEPINKHLQYGLIDKIAQTEK